MKALANRYDIVLLFDVKNGNPNGDPDAGNMPRLDPETSHGLVSDVALKRRIRNFTEMARGHEPGFRIYVREASVLNELHREAYLAVRGDTDQVRSEKSLNPQPGEESGLLKFMCENFYDVRTFGAVMSTGINAGQVRGPVQVTFACSVEPILPLEMTITRSAITAFKHGDGQDLRDSSSNQRRTMGKKHIVPYGLYRAHIFVSAKLAERTGFDRSDLSHLFRSLRLMFENDRSASKGEMTTRAIVAFKHASPIGNAASHELFSRVVVRRRPSDGKLRDLGHPSLPPARAFSDYAVSIDTANLPPGVEVLDILSNSGS